MISENRQASNRYMIKWQIAAWILLLTSACTSQRPIPGDPLYAPVVMPAASAAPVSNGSLFTDQSATSLFSDRKATRVGDILTIMLQENTVSRKSSNVDVSKDSETNIPEVAGAAGTVLGGGVSLGGLSLNTNLAAQRDFSGAADAAQSNNLNGMVTVSVTDVLPNGTLVVNGEKWLTLNRGDEFIRFSGLIRPDDIRSDNTIASTKVANARITYAGTGALADSQRMGWLNRFFNSAYWPF